MAAGSQRDIWATEVPTEEQGVPTQCQEEESSQHLAGKITRDSVCMRQRAAVDSGVHLKGPEHRLAG